ncbi:hypothetical protein DM01DRAFT_1403343 [Hesseltinella vesiculosa]|uniref:WW domain-containing protein n=1 Tax=Hesseltinella vesiculosa TaxID=101127 RepID=A0A1X2GXW7_9FUNG|nr:hypothetical protein DM01DRAFT_1403343 [Hesseltinella vesiculosa]
MQSTPRPRPPPPPPRPRTGGLPLPPGWMEYYAQGGRPYWYNTATGQTVWDRPIARPLPPPPPPKPVSQPQEQPKAKFPRKRIPGTRWLLVTSHEGIDFYYNKDTKSSVWEMPDELIEPLKVMREQAIAKRQPDPSLDQPEPKRAKPDAQPGLTDADNTPPATDSSPTLAPAIQEDADGPPEELEASEMTAEDLQWQLENMDADELAELGLEQDEQNAEQTQDSPDQDTTDAKMQEPTTAVADISEDEKMEAFMQLLHEKQISPFSTWEKELPKLIAEPRYNDVQPHSKRKTYFNNYCQTLAEEHRKMKQIQQLRQQSPEDQYKDLLEEMVRSKMYWDDFKRKAKNDPRFKMIRESKVRESLFKDHLRVLAQRGPTDAKSASTQNSARSRSAEDDYLDLLKASQLAPGMRWRDAKRLLEQDDRYHALSKTLREDMFRDYLDTLE